MFAWVVDKQKQDVHFKHHTAYNEQPVATRSELHA
jgi:hypothetical protein